MPNRGIKDKIGRLSMTQIPVFVQKGQLSPSNLMDYVIYINTPLHGVESVKFYLALTLAVRCRSTAEQKQSRKQDELGKIVSHHHDISN